jgi:quinol-cytochrome oxidoreductase complex cytochrome b subunit
MVTPLHIVPEWYFLPFYAALRAIDNKIMGIVYMLSIIFSMFLLPIFDSGKTRNPKNRPFFRIIFWVWIAAWVGLGYLGAQPLVYPYTIMHKPLLVMYFLFFLGIKWSNDIENITYKQFSKNS